MKKIITVALLAAALVPATVSAYTVDLNELSSWENNMRDRMAPPAAVLEARRAAQVNRLSCYVTLTNEQTGKQGRHAFTLSGEYSKQGGSRVYHEEDDTGSTTATVDENTGRVQLSMMDESSVIATGHGTCK